MPFEALAPEIRNIIYRLVLCEDEPVVVTPAGIPEPRLLLTSKPIRHEAAPIYYACNTFNVIIRHWDHSTHTKWDHKSRLVRLLYNVEPKTLRWFAADKPNRRNLLAWLKALHSGETRHYLADHPGGIVERDHLRQFEMNMITFMFLDARLSRDTPWQWMEQILEEDFRTLANMVDRRWSGVS